jgi:predicted RNA polymerase sigma factor
VAKRRAIDMLRRGRMLERKHAEIARELGEARGDLGEQLEAALDNDVGDELLGLIFIACHPVISADARVSVTDAEGLIMWETHLDGQTSPAGRALEA